MVPDFIPKQAFQDELKLVMQQIDQWALDFTDRLGKSQSTALLLKGTGEDKAWELKKLSKNLEEQYEQLQAALGDQKEAMVRYNEWIAHVKEKDVQLAERITQLLESKRRGEDKVSVAMADISSKLDYRKQKLDALRKATGWYKELLGIRCEYSNAVRFIFTNIDPTNPDREFSFSIHHDKVGNKFSMVDCNPNIAKSGPLLDALNTSNELSQFVRSMRWEFVALSAAESS
ncbi:unnamed protein product [Calypogeia fissa]